MIDFDHSILRCPISGESLKHTTPSVLNLDLRTYDLPILKDASDGFINESKSFFYPIVRDIALLLPYYAIPLQGNSDAPTTLAFDKERVFRYYNEIHYESYEESKVYGDSKKFVDFRPVTKDYLEHSFLNAKKYIQSEGKYFLDVASGPIGLKEYLVLSEDYEFRICMDISFNALEQAKHNLTEQKGIFICGDITNIPLQEGICDISLSQHTIYHVPKNEQESAVRELYRVTKSKGKTIIVYNWFYHSWFMNIATLPVQLYRVARHYAGKFYVRLFPKKARLYFYTHPPRWFRKMGYGDKLQIYAWRSVNKEFMKLYIHEWLGGRKLLSWIQSLEEKHPKLMGKIGDYPVIVIEK